MPTGTTDTEIERLQRLEKDHPERVTPRQRMSLAYAQNEQAEAER